MDPSRTTKLFARELIDGQPVDSAFVVRERVRREKRSGEPFLKLQLGDVSGAVDAVAWSVDDELWDACAPGSVVRVRGTYTVDPKYGGTLTVRALARAADGDYRPADVYDGPTTAYEQMVADLRSLIETVHNPWLRELLDRFFGEGSEIWRRWREAPAAKKYHQAYRHGLLEHCLSVAQAVGAASATFPGIDRDVAVTGALLHDVGKVEAYELAGGAIELTDAGRLQGEIALGYYLVRRTIDELPGFPSELAQAILHIVLSHHGLLEHGSPVVPCTREATLVHMIDNLGGKLGSFDRLEKSLQDGESWSGFDHALASAAYFKRAAA